MNIVEKILAGSAIGIFGLLVFAAVITITVVIFAGLSMLVCNWVLPMFDISYPITFMQGCGIGVIVAILRAVFSEVVVNK